MMQAGGRMRVGRDTETVLISVASFSGAALWKHETTVKAHPSRQNNHREEGANECCYKLRNR